MIAVTCKIIFLPKSKSIGPLLGEIYMAKVKTQHKRHIGQERVKSGNHRTNLECGGGKYKRHHLEKNVPEGSYLYLRICSGMNKITNHSLTIHPQR
jgi:hypothetical protein